MVISKIISFSLIYLLSNTPLHGISSLEAKINSIKEQQKIGNQLKFTPNPDIKTIEQQRSEFYAKEIVYPGSDLVVNPDDVLGSPDNKYAKIMPGGELIVKMEKPFSPLAFYNDGRLVVKGEAEYSVSVLVPFQESELKNDQVIPGKAEFAWMEVIPGVVTGGFDLPFAPQLEPLVYSSTREAVPGLGVNTLRIKNLGAKPLSIDAVIGYSDEKEKLGK
jgi:hypothetical protein